MANPWADNTDEKSFAEHSDDGRIPERAVNSLSNLGYHYPSQVPATTTAEELQEIDGIGPKQAKLIMNLLNKKG